MSQLLLCLEVLATIILLVSGIRLSILVSKGQRKEKRWEALLKTAEQEYDKLADEIEQNRQLRTRLREFDSEETPQIH